MEILKMMHASAPSPKSSRAERDLRVVILKSSLEKTVRFAAKEGPYTCDFLFVDWKLDVELDGPFHDAVADATRDKNLAKIGIVTLRLPFDMPPESMLQHILYVGGRIKFKPMPEKIVFLEGYRSVIRNSVGPSQQPEPTQAKRPHPDCLDCSGSGWRMVATWSAFLKKAVQSAARCSCTNLRPQAQFALSDEKEPTLSEMLFEWANKKPPQQATLFATAESLRNRA
jgi:very-short-patch-repair endonuclease